MIIVQTHAQQPAYGQPVAPNGYNNNYPYGNAYQQPVMYGAPAGAAPGQAYPQYQDPSLIDPVKK